MLGEEGGGEERKIENSRVYIDIGVLLCGGVEIETVRQLLNSLLVTLSNAPNLHNSAMHLPSSECSSVDPLCYFVELDPYPDYYFKADLGPGTGH